MPRVRATFMVTPILTKQEKKLRKQEDAELKRQAGLMRSKQAASRKAAAAAHKGKREKFPVLNQPAPASPPAKPVAGPPPLPPQPKISNTGTHTPPPPPEEELIATAPTPVVGGPTSLKPESPSPSSPPEIAPDLFAGNTRGYRTRTSYKYPGSKGYLGVPRPWLVIVLGGGLIAINLLTQDNFTPAIKAVSTKPSAATMRTPLTPKGTWLSVLGEVIFLIILATIARTSATASKMVIGFLLSLWLIWLIFRMPQVAKNKSISDIASQMFPSVDQTSTSSSNQTTTTQKKGGAYLHPRQILG